MVKRAETYVLGAMRKAVLIDGMFRREIPEYPREALREALANAIAHRDYSPYVRGSCIQLRMFADRVVSIRQWKRNAWSCCYAVCNRL
jgi:ATP-dependent DNA helicase RecG